MDVSYPTLLCFEHKGSLIYQDEVYDTCYLPWPTNTSKISKNSLQLSPNPTTGVVRLNNLPAGLKTLQIVNLQGAVLKEENSSANTTELDLSALPTGVYFITLSTKAGEVFTGKVVKQ